MSPRVVDDQHGRLTFADDLAGAVAHLLEVGAPAGTYDVTSGGASRSWADVAKAVFELRGRSGSEVTGVSTGEYADGRPMAPRPRHSTLSLDKIAATGWVPVDQEERLRAHLAR